MEIKKAHWQTEGGHVRLTMPLAKVDTENRIVSGFATLDNVDTSKDIVLASASKDAFDGFRGNIRLMHQPIPAGKLVNFREEQYFDQKTQKMYEGIFVDVYVSKGAPEVWEMVLDGTLTGFSIGGNITDAENKFMKDAGGTVRIIKSYDLVELSLVDSPANQLSNIFSITKAADGSTEITGMVAEVNSENVFWCRNDEIAFTSAEEARNCSVCAAPAENIGWFEYDGGDKTEKVNAIVADFAKADTVEGRENDMADETTVDAPEVEVEVVAVEVELDEAIDAETAEKVAEEVAEVVEEVVAEEAADEEVTAKDDTETEVDEAAGDDEETVETPNFEKMFEDLASTIRKALDDSSDATEAAFVKVNDQLATLGSVADKIEELVEKHAALEEKFNAVNSQIEGVEKRFESVEKGVGFKKSGDLGGSKEDKAVEKAATSRWGGRFFGSVDNL